MKTTKADSGRTNGVGRPEPKLTPEQNARVDAAVEQGLATIRMAMNQLKAGAGDRDEFAGSRMPRPKAGEVTVFSNRDGILKRFLTPYWQKIDHETARHLMPEIQKRISTRLKAEDNVLIAWRREEVDFACSVGFGNYLGDKFFARVVK